MGAQPSKATDPVMNEKHVYSVDSATQSLSGLTVSSGSSSSHAATATKGEPLSSDGSIVPENLNAWDKAVSEVSD